MDLSLNDSKTHRLAVAAIFTLGVAGVAHADAMPSLTMQWMASNDDTSSPLSYNLANQSEVQNLGNGAWQYSGAQENASDNWAIAWDMTASADNNPQVGTGSGGGPFVTANLAVTNTSSSVQSFWALVTLELDDPIVGGTLMNGQASAGVTDVFGTGGTVSTISSGQYAGDPLFAGLIDGNTQQTLMDDPFSVVADPFDSNSESDEFGQPGSPVVGPDAMNNISVWLKFDLTPGDTANVVGTFQVAPIPGPATVPALAIAGLFAGVRRRRRN